jgi:Cof subfamily protein (haloacid dehalogenase superfamily)
MIRLIATDLDDTILPEGTFDLNPEYYEVIRELRRKGILFVASSGRHASSILRLFDCVKDDVVILAGNGSLVLYQGKVIDSRELDHALYLEVLEEMRKAGPSLILTDHPECVWTDTDREDMIHWIRDGYRVRLGQCEDIAKLPSPILKVAMLLEEDAVQEASVMRARIAGRANVMAAGARWVDVVANDADKGTALSKIQAIFGISREETAAFGDNGNDIGMLELAGTSYAVENARPQVKAVAGEVIGPMRKMQS